MPFTFLAQPQYWMRRRRRVILQYFWILRWTVSLSLFSTWSLVWIPRLLVDTILGYAYDDEDEHEKVVERRVVLIPSFQVLKCTLIPQRWTLDVDPVTKLVLPGSKRISPNTARYFEPLNPEKESPWIPTKGTEFEHDATLVSQLPSHVSASGLIYVKWKWRDMFNDIPDAPEVHIDDIVNASCSQTPGEPRTLCGLGSFTTMDEWARPIIHVPVFTPLISSKLSHGIFGGLSWFSPQAGKHRNDCSLRRCGRSHD